MKKFPLLISNTFFASQLFYRAGSLRPCLSEMKKQCEVWSSAVDFYAGQREFFNVRRYKAINTLGVYDTILDYFNLHLWLPPQQMMALQHLVPFLFIKVI